MKWLSNLFGKKQSVNAETAKAQETQSPATTAQGKNKPAAGPAPAAQKTEPAPVQQSRQTKERKLMDPRPTPDAVYCPCCSGSMTQLGAFGSWWCSPCKMAHVECNSLSPSPASYSTVNATTATKCRASGWTVREKQGDSKPEFIIDCL